MKTSLLSIFIFLAIQIPAQENWMANVPDKTSIADMSLPGTHDAAAWTRHEKWPGIKGVWAQRKTVTEQLNLGVRVLDLRVGYASDLTTLGTTSFIGMFHGMVYLDITLEQVLTEVHEWLSQESHSKEFVILLFQQQGKKGQRDVAPAVGEMVKKIFVDNIKPAESQFYSFNQNQNQWPVIEKLRGKVMAMGRLRSHVQGFCDVREWTEPANDNTEGVFIKAGDKVKLFVQDRYKGALTSSFDTNVTEKYKLVIKSGSPTLPPKMDKNQVIVINHMSLSNLKWQPWEIGLSMNKLLVKDKVFKMKGVIMIDDADAATVAHIVKWNKP
jgi:1-phosphatidylinositol phosphodiesterase